MMRCVDFEPRVKRQGGFLNVPEMEGFYETLGRVNAWLDEVKVEVVNIETVVLPNIHHPHEQGSLDTQLHASGDMSTGWYQVIRVWYRKEK